MSVFKTFDRDQDRYSEKSTVILRLSLPGGRPIFLCFGSGSGSGSVCSTASGSCLAPSSGTTSFWGSVDPARLSQGIHGAQAHLFLVLQSILGTACRFKRNVFRA